MPYFKTPYRSPFAVEKQGSASSQNQAFNALLFLYQQALEKEFGRIKGVVRAKCRLSVPVMLLRENIESIFDQSGILVML